MSALEATRADYATLGLSHAHHPMAFHRAALTARGVLGSLPGQVPERVDPVRDEGDTGLAPIPSLRAAAGAWGPRRVEQ